MTNLEKFKEKVAEMTAKDVYTEFECAHILHIITGESCGNFNCSECPCDSIDAFLNAEYNESKLTQSEVAKEIFEKILYCVRINTFAVDDKIDKDSFMQCLIANAKKYGVEL